MSICTVRPARDLAEVLERGTKNVRCCVTCGSPEFDYVGVYEPSRRYRDLTGRWDNIVYAVCSDCRGRGVLATLGPRLERSVLAGLGVADEPRPRPGPARPRRRAAQRRDVRRR